MVLYLASGSNNIENSEEAEGWVRKLLAGMLMGLSAVVSTQTMSVDKYNSDKV